MVCHLRVLLNSTLFNLQRESCNYYVVIGVFQDGQTKTLMWQKVGSQADEWKQGLVQLSPSQSLYQVGKGFLLLVFPVGAMEYPF